MAIARFIHRLSAEKLFLLDSLGALSTALLTGIVLPGFRDFFGMPAKPLYMLAATALAFSFYSLLCYLFAKKMAKPFMQCIAVLNFLYCCTTIAVVIYHRATVTTWGWLYFSVEAVIIFLLVYIEITKARSMQ